MHPSDPPAALLALDAAVVLSSAGGSRTLLLADFFALPTHEHRVENVLQSGELVLNGVAPIPWRAEAAEGELQGRPLDEGAIGRAVEAALADAQALSKNRYKIPLASGLIRQALRGLTQ